MLTVTGRRTKTMTSRRGILSRPGPSLLTLVLATGACDDGEFATDADDAADELPAKQNDEGELLAELGLGDQGPEVAAAYVYLRRFGYFPNPELAAHYPGWTPVIDEDPEDPEVFGLALAEALSRYQEAYGLPVTGRLDVATQVLMRQPRCGFPDHFASQPIADASGTVTAGPEGAVSGDDERMLEDFVAGAREPTAYKFSGKSWSSTDLRYGFTKLSGDIGAAFQRQSVISAMTTWSAVAPVAWTERANPDVAVSFVPRVHGDPYTFDTITYAHGFYPDCSSAYGDFSCTALAGDVHFNDESFTWGSGGTVLDIQSVALHELGHALGLDHSSDPNAIMYGTAAVGAVRRNLTADDINGIKALYPTFQDQRIYDANWYLELNPDLVGIIGWDPGMGSTHWLKFGRNEARRGTPAFDVGYYLKTNPSVAQSIGVNNYAEAFWHWREIGLKQGLPSSAAFDAKYYLNRYPELQNSLGATNYSLAMVHWLAHGINEGRRAAKAFDPVYYLQANPDVAQAYGAFNYRKALIHWLTDGIKQGRPGAAP